MLRGATAIAKFIAVVALLVGAGAALLVSGVRPVGAQMPMVIDYDVNDNGLIEVGNLDQLNAMRWDLDGDGDPAAANTSSYLAAFPGRDVATSTRMGCPMGNCAGYELTADLTFPTSTGAYNPWTPIGVVLNSFVTTFDGNGHTLTGLTASSSLAGLFGSVWTNGVIKNLGVIDANVTVTGSNGNGGVIAGLILAGGQVNASYVQGGSVNLAGDYGIAGGLAGASLGVIRASYATAAVGSVDPRLSSEVGGLVGNLVGGTIIASYAAGPVSAPAGSIDVGVGGLAGRARSPDSVITDSYCDIEATGQNACVGRQLTQGGDPPGATSTTVTVDGKTTAELQTPTRYAGIYRDWNIDLDGDGRRDHPWNFGTESDYPRLNTPEQRAALADSPPPGGPRYAQPPQDTPYDPGGGSS